MQGKLFIAFTTTVLATALLAVVSLFAPTPAAWQQSDTLFHFHLALALLYPALYVIAALFFFQGLQGFKQSLRRAYRLIAIGLVIQGLALVESSIITFFDLWDAWPMTLGAVNIPYLVALAITFTGVRVFYEELHVKSIWRSVPFVIGLISAGMLVVVLLPHAPSNLPEAMFDFSNAMFAFSTFALLVIGLTIFAVRHAVAITYQKVLFWLGLGFVILGVLVSGSFTVALLGIDPRGGLTNLQSILLLTSLPFIRAGYLFYRLTADVRAQAPEKDATTVDLIVYVAELASDTRAIDSMLERVRVITATQQGRSLSDQDQAVLADVYLQLEDYLVNYERQRTFTADALREKIYSRYHNPSSPKISDVFWSKVPRLEYPAQQYAAPNAAAGLA